MKFIKKLLLKWVKEGVEVERSASKQEDSGLVALSNQKSNRISVGPPSLDNGRGMRFTTYKANGGTVIETQQYDHRKDHHVNGLYVITNEQDLGHEIAKIITMESLRV